MNTFNQTTLSQRVLIAISIGVLLLGVVLGISYASIVHADTNVMVSTSPNSGNVGTGSTIDVWFSYPSNASSTATSTNVTTSSCMVNGVDVKNSFQNVSPGMYKATYTVGATDASRMAGQLPINCTLTGDQTIMLTSFTDNNTVSISAGAYPSDNNNEGSNNNGSSTATTTGTSTGSVGGSVIGGTDEADAELMIRSINQVRTVATAGGGFEQGWAWMFNLTVPNKEKNVQIKFNDWVHTNGSSTIPVAQNMRISSMQSNSTSTTMLTGSGVYSIPLMLTTDTDPSMPGRQVQVFVEMQVPTDAKNGSYTTGYGVQSYE